MKCGAESMEATTLRAFEGDILELDTAASTVSCWNLLDVSPYIGEMILS